ncbi:MAG TPA: FAD-dependent oxidoreductase, partial [Ferruginibacter sp.]|nr:FAD-dependent oxidoreductase [Ferruginibacter sp.]
MQQNISLKLLPSQAASEDIIKQHIATTAGKKLQSITGFHILKKSIDARGKSIFINLKLNAFIDEPFLHRPGLQFNFKDVSHAQKKVLIAGAGPAGLFAALKLIEAGIKPIIIERGKEVRARRRDLAQLNKEGIINPESNYCFGEGGAGTYSDGKLYTRSNKRGDINRILQLFVQFGATENILYEAHPHIGTNKLPQIITAMRQLIISSGGEVLFEKKLIDFSVENNSIAYIQTADGERITADAYILATGHSARDIFSLLHSKNILIEAKPFALGVRIEHPQSLIDSVQYHCKTRGEFCNGIAHCLLKT